MKNGKSIVELATEIHRRQEAKADFIADTRELLLTGFDGQTPKLQVGDETKQFGITDICHRQIGDRVGIPAKYYDRMRAESTPLLAMNVNHWFREAPQRRMVRTLDGNARALLSDRYQRIDNEHVAEVVLPILGEMPGIKIESCEITEKKLYIKAVNERTEGEVKKGDAVQAGVCITNSEIGMGALGVQKLIFRLVCLNGMIVPDSQYRRSHIGARADASDDVYEMLSDEALRADDNAILLKVRDVVKASLDEALFAQTVAKMRVATEGAQMDDPIKGIERLASKVGLLESEKASVLTHLIRGGDLSRYGVLNAVTRAAQDVESYDRSTEMELIGGNILELNRSQWEEVAIAA